MSYYGVVDPEKLVTRFYLPINRESGRNRRFGDLGINRCRINRIRVKRR